MELGQFWIMRHEIILTALAVVYLLLQLNVSKENEHQNILWVIGMFLVATVVGFLPAETGELFGGSYHNDGLTILMKNVLNIGVLLIFIQSAVWMKENPENRGKITEYYLLIITTLIGMSFMISSGDFLMFYLGLELSTIPLAALAAYQLFEAKSSEAGVKLILSSALSSGVALFGISLLYAATGSTYFDPVAANIGNSALETLGAIFFFSGLAFKISIVPFHFWTADVYEGAPINISAYLSVVSKGAATFILLILLFQVFRSVSEVWQDLIWITSILTMSIGNLFAIRQNNIKRFLAFSSIAQAGFIFLGVISGTQEGMATVIYFVLIYIFSNLGAFGVAAIISYRTGKENISDYNGLYRTNPRLSLVMLLSMFSLAGIPPVAGFFGKFFLFTAAASQGFYLLVTIAVINAVVSLYYYLLVVKAMFINKSEAPIERIESDWLTKVGLAICVVGLIATGFASNIYAYIYSFSWGM
jgi:NADH-quinone oxidoreductase subunit N